MGSFLNVALLIGVLLNQSEFDCGFVGDSLLAETLALVHDVQLYGLGRFRLDPDHALDVERTI